LRGAQSVIPKGVRKTYFPTEQIYDLEFFIIIIIIIIIIITVFFFVAYLENVYFVYIYLSYVTFQILTVAKFVIADVERFMFNTQVAYEGSNFLPNITCIAMWEPPMETSHMMRTSVTR
jgi:hypothetical protein